jgi:hypothetical protein
LLKPKNFKYLVRALAYLGLVDEIVKASDFTEKRLDRQIDGRHVYFSELSPYLERFGFDQFLEFIIELKNKGIARINGLHQILVSDAVIRLSDEEKIKILGKLIETGYEIYIKELSDLDSDKELEILTQNHLSSPEVLNLLGQPEWTAEILKFISLISCSEYSSAVEFFRENSSIPAIKRKWSLLLLTFV